MENLITKEEFNATVSTLEEKLDSILARIAVTPEEEPTHPDGARNAAEISRSSPVGDTNSDIQGGVKAIGDSLRSVTLPPELRLNDTRGHTGIRKSDQPTANIIAKLANFAEIGLKVVGTVAPDNVTEANLQDIHIVFQAMMEYAQDEYSTLFVQGAFPHDSVTKFFKTFNKGTSALLPRHRDALSTAVNILGPAGCYGQNPEHSRNDYRNQQGNRRFQRGGYNNFRRGRGSYNTSVSRDVFNDATSNRFTHGVHQQGHNAGTFQPRQNMD